MHIPLRRGSKSAARPLGWSLAPLLAPAQLTLTRLVYASGTPRTEVNAEERTQI